MTMPPFKETKRARARVRARSLVDSPLGNYYYNGKLLMLTFDPTNWAQNVAASHRNIATGTLPKEHCLLTFELWLCNILYYYQEWIVVPEVLASYNMSRTTPDIFRLFLNLNTVPV